VTHTAIQAFDKVWNLVDPDEPACPLDHMPDYCKGCVEQRGYTKVEAITAPYAVYRWEDSDSLMAPSRAEPPRNLLMQLACTRRSVAPVI